MSKDLRQRKPRHHTNNDRETGEFPHEIQIRATFKGHQSVGERGAWENVSLGEESAGGESARNGECGYFQKCGIRNPPFGTRKSLLLPDVVEEDDGGGDGGTGEAYEREQFVLRLDPGQAGEGLAGGAGAGHEQRDEEGQ